MLGINTHVTLLQDISEAVCGTALPPELCRMILIRQKGMQSPTAALVCGRMRKGTGRGFFDSEWEWVEAHILYMSMNATSMYEWPSISAMANWGYLTPIPAWAIAEIDAREDEECAGL
jgi:hypothetical protein